MFIDSHKVASLLLNSRSHLEKDSSPFPNYFGVNTKYKLSHTDMVQLIKVLLNFFLNQQFITWGTRADRGSYIVTTYMTTNLHDTKKQIIKEEEKKGRRERRMNEKLN